MCGIAGIVAYGTERAVDDDVLAGMLDELRHRGPDGEGLWRSQDRRVGLAHTRLAILDPEGGSQPMEHPHGLVVVFNGEIYNYPELRRNLEREGVKFSTRCDTEVILHLYARHGADCVDHLNGMFAFALWDERQRRLFFARDRIGEKPLYFADLGGTFVFGSEIKALFRHPLVTPAVNEAALNGYLTNLVTASPETLFAGIHKLPPGYRGFCSAKGVRTESYWSAFLPRRWRDISFETASHTVREHLERSVSQRLLSDVPVGILLSGGLDSTTLVALLREQAQDLATFSVGFDSHPELDERTEARKVARYFGTDHHEVAISEQDALGFLPTLIRHQDEPLADPVCMPLYFVCGLARQNGVPVVLAGEGSDELFWGYPAYTRIIARQRWMRAFVRLPRIGQRAVVAAVPRRHAQLQDLAEGMVGGRPLPMHMPLGLTHRQRLELLGADDLDRSAGWRPSQPENSGADVIERLGFDTQEYEFSLRLPELLLMRIDRFSMAHGVEARVPFLDPELVRFVYRLPISHKLDGGEGKRVLRAAIRDIVPEWVIRRPKQGFGAPVASWFGSLFGELMETQLRGEAVRRYFDVAMIERALAAARAQTRYQLDLWPILNFALWHRHWIEGESLDSDVEAYAAAPHP